MKIPRTAVTSSLLVSLGYDAQTLQLDVEFKAFKRKGETEQPPNRVYRYQNVSPTDYQAIINAESVGREFNQRIKALPGTYPHRQLSPEEAK